MIFTNSIDRDIYLLRCFPINLFCHYILLIFSEKNSTQMLIKRKKIVQWLTYYKLLTIHIIVYLYRISVKKDSNVYRCLTKYNSMEFHSCVYEPVFDLYNVGSIPLDPFHLFDWHVILFLKDSRWVVHMFSFKDIPLRFYSVISKQYLT